MLRHVENPILRISIGVIDRTISLGVARTGCDHPAFQHGHVQSDHCGSKNSLPVMTPLDPLINARILIGSLGRGFHEEASWNVRVHRHDREDPQANFRRSIIDLSLVL